MDHIFRCLPRTKISFIYIVPNTENNRLAFPRSGVTAAPRSGRTAQDEIAYVREGDGGLVGWGCVAGVADVVVGETALVRRLDFESWIERVRGGRGLGENGMGRAGGMVEEVILQNRGDV